jgi:hypothetical protein
MVCIDNRTQNLFILAGNDEEIEKLKEAIDSLQDISQLEPNVQSNAISIQELHEFLTITIAPA